MSQSTAHNRPTRAAVLIVALVFVATAALYLSTAGPTLGGGFDSAEFQHVAYSLGIAHPTGYPLYLLLGKLFTTLVPIGNVAYRMNILSALLGAAAAAFFYLNAQLLTGRYVASLAATTVYVTNVGVWRQSGVASNYPLNLLLIGALVCATLLWSKGRVPLAIPGLVLGLGLAHHRSILILLPCILLLLIVTRTNRRSTHEWWTAAAATVFPLLFYLYLPAFGNGSPWYSNTLPVFVSYVTGGDAGSYVRLSPDLLVGAASALSSFLFDSFSYFGVGLAALGVISVLPGLNRHKSILRSQPPILFLVSATILMVAFAIGFDSEQDRYFSLPFLFLTLWLAIGAAETEILFESRLATVPARRAARGAFAIALALLVVVPFRDHYQQANWSTYDREYKQADEIFTLPLPRGAVIVGDWRQLNGMRYMQRVEGRRPDLVLVGSQFETEPQMVAAENAFAQGRTIFLAPGVAVPGGTYRYAQLGPLLEVRDTPQMLPPASSKQALDVMPELTLADWGTTTALEPFAPATNIAPTRSIRVWLTWHPKASIRDFLVRLRLYDPDQRLVSQKDEAPVRGLYPPSHWEPGEYILDVKNFMIPAGTPPGKYGLKMTLLDTDTKAPASSEIALDEFIVNWATNTPRDQVFVQHPVDIALDRHVYIAGYGGLDDIRRPGDVLGFYLLWGVQDNVGTNHRLHLALADASGNAVVRWTRAPLDFYPTEQWQAGEWLKAYYDIELPKDLAPGEYKFAAGLQEQSPHTLARIRIAP